MVENYKTATIEDKKNAMKEVVQEIVLASLSKTDFFKNAAFYGGTALRIFYGLDRFSEDLDFTLLTPDVSFSLEKYIPTISQVVKSLGLNLEIENKDKTKDSFIKSAFLKGNTKEQFLIFYPGAIDNKFITSNEKIKIKFEIDVNPPKFAKTELKYRLLPFPFQVKVYDKPSLFAGKIHAVLARGWKSRVKGRDLYDFVFYLASKTSVNIKHLEARLQQTSHLALNEQLTRTSLINLLKSRFDQIDFEAAKKDITPFIEDIEALTLWSSDFFKDISERIIVDIE